MVEYHEIEQTSSETEAQLALRANPRELKGAGKPSFAPDRDLRGDWQKRDAARKVAKSAKAIWALSNKAELHKLARLAELMFYEAYGRSGGRVEQDVSKS